jgi:hypothetical protein
VRASAARSLQACREVDPDAAGEPSCSRRRSRAANHHEPATLSVLRAAGRAGAWRDTPRGLRIALLSSAQLLAAEPVLNVPVDRDVVAVHVDRRGEGSARLAWAVSGAQVWREGAAEPVLFLAGCG